MNYKTYEVMVWENGTEKWFLKGWFHRENGPAMTYSDGTKKWFLNGQLHREDGPAWIHACGKKEWWLKDRKYTKAQWEKKMNTHQGKIVEIEGKRYKLQEV